MKLKYLGDSKDSFKGDYHDYLVQKLRYPFLNIAFMMTPDDESNNGKSPPSLFPARGEIIEFCEHLQKKRSIQVVRRLPKITGSIYKVKFHEETLAAKLDHEHLRQSGFETPELSCPRRRASRHRGFPIKDFGNDTVIANLDSNDKESVFINRTQYFSNFSADANQILFLDPDNGFEPEKSYSEKHVLYSDIALILGQISDDSVISVFQHFRRKSFVKDFARIKERLHGGYATAIYWHSLMFVAIGKSQKVIARVGEANEKYSRKYPVKVIA